MAFIKDSSEEVKKNIKIRTYSKDYNWCISDRISDYDALKLVDNDSNLAKGFRERLKGCRLCVATYNATIFLETFTFNYPTLIFFDLKYWELNPNAKKYFDKLEQVGILHYSVKSLNIKLNQIYLDPMDWWLSLEVQAAKDYFCGQFANTSNAFVQSWNKEINGLIKND